MSQDPACVRRKDTHTDKKERHSCTQGTHVPAHEKRTRNMSSPASSSSLFYFYSADLQTRTDDGCCCDSILSLPGVPAA